MKKGHTDLGNGCRLYWKPDGVGGRHYYTDEVGGGATVWITSTVSREAMLAALATEELLCSQEKIRKEKQNVG